MRQKVFLILVFLCFMQDLFAQCAMCKAVAEDQTVEDQGALNAGILYIMIIPYLILFFAFRKKIVGFLKELRKANG